MSLRSLSLLVAAFLVGLPLQAKDDSLADSTLRIQGIFNSPLPGTERRNTLRLILHPHLGDLTDRDHLRVPFGVRYALTDDWEATLDLEAYASHGLKDVPIFDDTGLSRFHLGTKYHVGNWPFAAWDTAVGADYTHPLGSPPADVTDGLEHIAPFVTFARPVARYPGLRVFWGLGADLVNRTQLVVTPRRNEFGDDAANLSLGAVWHRAPFTYTLETTWSTSSGIGGERNGDTVTLRPGVVWEVPSRFTFGASGQWLLGLGLRATNGPDGTEFGAAAKVRVNFDFKRLLGRRRSAEVGR